jgi:hypothetical protein
MLDPYIRRTLVHSPGQAPLAGDSEAALSIASGEGNLFVAKEGSSASTEPVCASGPGTCGVHAIDVVMPDVFGVFQFIFEYRRVGYTSMDLRQKAVVRPLKHNEHDRFIPAAFPYYASAFSVMAGFLLFSVVFLYSLDSGGKAKMA